MDAGGGSRTRLTSNHVSDHDPVWSPDGTKIAYVAAFAGPGSSEIYAINPDGTGFTRLTHNHVTEQSPTWQPVAAP
jgi:Tol biopolymer transport system component